MAKYYELNNDFSHVYLEDSYVIDVKENPNSIEFIMEFVLTEDNPFYSSPKVGEQYCYRNGRIIFHNVIKARWIKKDFRPIEDADGAIVYGNIDSLTFENGKYELEGEWGELSIESDEPKIIMEGTQ